MLTLEIIDAVELRRLRSPRASSWLLEASPRRGEQPRRRNRREELPIVDKDTAFPSSGHRFLPRLRRLPCSPRLATTTVMLLVSHRCSSTFLLPLSSSGSSSPRKPDGAAARR